MTPDEWRIFAERVPPRTMIQQPDTPVIIDGKPSYFHGELGILLETQPFRAGEIACDASTLQYNDPDKLQKMFENHLWFQPFRHIGQMAHDARLLRYLINGDWYTFEEIMKRD